MPENRVFGQAGGACPKTQKSDLKVEFNNQFETELKKDMESEDSLAIHSKTKVDDGNHAKIVFGQAVGGGTAVTPGKI